MNILISWLILHMQYFLIQPESCLTGNVLKPVRDNNPNPPYFINSTLISCVESCSLVTQHKQGLVCIHQDIISNSERGCLSSVILWKPDWNILKMVQFHKNTKGLHITHNLYIFQSLHVGLFDTWKAEEGMENFFSLYHL